MDAEKCYWRDRYDGDAALFAEDWRVGRWGSPHYYAMVHACVRRMLIPLRGASPRVLDTCCGSGALLETLHTHGFRPVGLDCSMGVLRRLKANPARSIIPILWADASHIPVRDASFDIVISIGLLQCFHDATPYLAELARVLNPQRGRLLLLFSPGSRTNRRRWAQAMKHGSEDMAHYQLHDVAAIVQALQSMGFTKIDTRSLYYVFYAPLLRPCLRFMNRYCKGLPWLTPWATSTVILAERV